MLYEYALTPQVFGKETLEDDRAMQIILWQFLDRLAEPGLVAKLGKDKWYRVIDEALRNLSPGARDKVRTALIYLDKRNRLVRHPKAIDIALDAEADWLYLARRDHEQRPLCAVIVSQPTAVLDDLTKVPRTVPLSDVLDLEKHPRSVRITQNEEGLETVLAPVLRYAGKVRLIDPFLDRGEAGYRATLRLCIGLMRQIHDGPARTLECHTELRGDAEESLDKWEDFLREYITARAPSVKIHFKVFLWSDTKDKQWLHSRYIITDQCGLGLPDGLKCLKQRASSAVVTLLENEVVEQVVRDFDEASSPFSLVGCREIPRPL